MHVSVSAIVDDSPVSDETDPAAEFEWVELEFSFMCYLLMSAEV